MTFSSLPKCLFMIGSEILSLSKYVVCRVPVGLLVVGRVFGCWCVVGGEGVRGVGGVRNKAVGIGLHVFNRSYFIIIEIIQ